VGSSVVVVVVVHECPPVVSAAGVEREPGDRLRCTAGVTKKTKSRVKSPSNDRNFAVEKDLKDRSNESKNWAQRPLNGLMCVCVCGHNADRWYPSKPPVNVNDDL